MEVTDAEEQACSLQELYEADEVFFASTVREVQTVASIDDHEYSGPSPVSDRTREAVSARIAEQLRG
jgi:branched-subunit amino acid aminotransferase/4-amino-4-deoxychorismate lyase